MEANDRQYLAMHKYKIWQSENDHRWCTYLPPETKWQERKCVRRKNKNDLLQCIIQYYRGTCDEDITFEEAFSKWVQHQLSLERISYATGNRLYSVYHRHYQKFGKQILHEIQPSDYVEFMESEVANKHLTAKGYANFKQVISGTLKYSKRKKWISFLPDDVFSELDFSRRDFRKPIHGSKEEVFNVEEMDTIISYLKEHLDTQNIGILLMFITGMRVGELAALKHEDFCDGYVMIHRTETKYCFDGKYHYDVKDFPKTEAGVRAIVIPDSYQWLIRKITELNPTEEYVFVSSRTKKRMSTNCFRTRLRNICDELGIYRKSPHKIRKTYGTILLDNHVDNSVVTSLMGHTNIAVTEGYYHRDRKSLDQKRMILDQISDFSKG
ncbi:tyrosine-type recombinase/integrase [Clostridium vitabionis]|uniref:tyrosine-type recombinase/integrase n=1 Tax=Clostridium vitabionis TaxID=2784388 RepID=UPI00188B91E6|nr:site-specific integrase [Clostridium vitabionis]